MRTWRERRAAWARAIIAQAAGGAGRAAVSASRRATTSLASSPRGGAALLRSWFAARLGIRASRVTVGQKMGFTAAVPAARRVPATRVSTITMWSNPDSPLLHGAAAIWRTRSAFAPYAELGLHTPASRARAILGHSLTHPFSTTVLAASSSSAAPPSASSRSPPTPRCRCACPALRRPSSSCSSRSSARRSSRRARASRSRCFSRRAGRRRTSRPAARWRWSRCARWPLARMPAHPARPLPRSPPSLVTPAGAAPPASPASQDTPT